MNIKEMTGLEILKAMMQGQIPPASISETIPMQPYEVSEGSISFKAKADARHLNPLGGVRCYRTRFGDRLRHSHVIRGRCRLWHHRLKYKNVSPNPKGC